MPQRNRLTNESKVKTKQNRIRKKVELQKNVNNILII